MSVHSHIDQMLEELRSVLAQVDGDQCGKLATAIADARAVFVSGAGRSGLAMRSFAMRLMHLGFEVHVVGETTTPGMTSQDLHLIGSGSGSTVSLVANADKARALGARIALITAREDSPIGHLADVIVTIDAPTPKSDRELGLESVQPMGSLFEQALWLTLDAIVLLLMNKAG